MAAIINSIINIGNKGRMCILLYKLIKGNMVISIENCSQFYPLLLLLIPQNRGQRERDREKEIKTEKEREKKEERDLEKEKELEK